MRRFPDLTGIKAAGIRQAAGQPGVLAGLLDSPPPHETDVVAVSLAAGTAHETVPMARGKLDRGPAG